VHVNFRLSLLLSCLLCNTERCLYVIFSFKYALCDTCSRKQVSRFQNMTSKTCKKTGARSNHRGNLRVKVAIEAYSKLCSVIIPCVTVQLCLICHTSTVHLCSSHPRLLLQENLLLLFQLFKCFLYGNLVNPSNQQCHLLSLSICLCF
jgi:hypothetical protein